jgi:hypothetical protein
MAANDKKYKDIANLEYRDEDVIFIEVFPYKTDKSKELYENVAKMIPFNGDPNKSTLDNITGGLDSVAKEVKDAFKADHTTYVGSKSIDEFFFPSPSSLTDNYSQMYEIDEYNLDNKLASAGLTKIIDVISTRAPGLSGSIEDIAAITEHLGRRNNMSIDPNSLSVYIGSKPRNFNFTLQMIPKNIKEAEIILQSIERLRTYSLGKKNPVSLIKDVFQLQVVESANIFTFSFYKKTVGENNIIEYIENTKLNTLMGIGRDSSGFFINGFDVDVGASGDNVQLFREKRNNLTNRLILDHIPKLITVNISLVERRPMYSEDWMRFINSRKKKPEGEKK